MQIRSSPVRTATAQGRIAGANTGFAIARRRSIANLCGIKQNGRQAHVSQSFALFSWWRLRGTIQKRKTNKLNNFSFIRFLKYFCPFLHKVKNHEINEIRKACMTIDPSYRPGVTFVIASKRNHTRFFPEKCQNSVNDFLNRFKIFVPLFGRILFSLKGERLLGQRTARLTCGHENCHTEYVRLFPSLSHGHTRHEQAMSLFCLAWREWIYHGSTRLVDALFVS